MLCICDCVFKKKMFGMFKSQLTPNSFFEFLLPTRISYLIVCVHMGFISNLTSFMQTWKIAVTLRQGGPGL